MHVLMSGLRLVNVPGVFDAFEHAVLFRGVLHFLRLNGLVVRLLRFRFLGAGQQVRDECPLDAGHEATVCAQRAQCVVHL